MMRRLVFVACLLSLSVLAIAQSPFDGTWKMDPSTIQYPKKPDVYLLQNGMYDCKTCVPPIHVKADGTDQKLSGDPYADTLSVKVIDDRNIETTAKKDGKVVGTTKRSVSSDGNTLTVDWAYSGNPSGGTQTGNYTNKRVDKGPAGAHLISGSWRTEKEQDSEAVLTWTNKTNGNELTMTSPTGQSYTAKLDGTEAPMKGDPGVTTVQVKQLGKDTLEQINLRDGKVIGIGKMIVSADGKTAKLVYEDKLQETTTKAEATKQ